MMRSGCGSAGPSPSKSAPPVAPLDARKPADRGCASVSGSTASTIARPSSTPRGICTSTSVRFPRCAAGIAHPTSPVAKGNVDWGGPAWSRLATCTEARADSVLARTRAASNPSLYPSAAWTAPSAQRMRVEGGRRVDASARSGSTAAALQSRSPQKSLAHRAGSQPSDSTAVE